MTLTPPTSAVWQSLFSRDRAAWYRATPDDEQAVSVTIEGPPKENAYDILPLKKAAKVPVEY
jgi:hypothetical protein